MKPILPLHRWPPERYQNAASHSDPEPFRQRMAERMVRAVHREIVAEILPHAAWPISYVARPEYKADQQRKNVESTRAVENMVTIKKEHKT